MNSPADTAIRQQVPEDAAGVRDVIRRAFAAQRNVVDLEEGQERHTLRRSALEIQRESTAGSAPPSNPRCGV